MEQEDFMIDIGRSQDFIINDFDAFPSTSEQYNQAPLRYSCKIVKITGSKKNPDINPKQSSNPVRGHFQNTQDKKRRSAVNPPDEMPPKKRLKKNSEVHSQKIVAIDNRSDEQFFTMENKVGVEPFEESVRWLKVKQQLKNFDEKTVSEIFKRIKGKYFFL